ncbi:MAG TPA: PAS domain S-box protein [Noviherbaspirillum sp.]|uniref:PAS domain-containing sensor histidine kinase n=1 Tax=Noviherbaspirillum sp. TaxID=1926288 RepID=UPI002D3E2D46|nr:PAS domain S-box protein [Noviherbaspirillum sp.]HYD97088.1 PAS domain S-box protein [Noviherbaspirillum sp.]
MDHDDDKRRGDAGRSSLSGCLPRAPDGIKRTRPAASHHDTGADSAIPSSHRALAVEEAVAHYTDLYERAPVAYFRLDRHGVILEVNLSGAGLLGATRSALLRRRLREFISLDMHASFTEFLKQVFASEAKESCELRFLDSGRNPFFAHLEANADPARQSCRVVLCDVSERKKAELSLIESEERFRLMADSAPVLIWITGPDMEYLWFNRMWLEFTGRRLEEELGTGWRNGIHPDDLAACAAAHDAAFALRRSFTLEYRLKNSDGGYHFMLAHGVPRLSPSGGFLGYIGTCTDISERKKIEDELQHSRQMLRHLISHQERVREDERKRIARELHDDLGQNLLALRLEVSILQRRTGRTHPRLNERVRSALGQIDATMKAVRAAINNLRPTVLDLGLAAAIEWQLQDFQRRSGIVCELAMEDDVALDDDRATALFRIVQESLNNVLRHSQASTVRVALRREGARMQLRIADNGIGIVPDRCRKANSFGLVGIEERINAFGGSLEILSGQDSGTALVVSLPLPPA